jgi:ABC-type glycerol-3-phosphate transport system substrate-binding protein
MIMKRQVTLLLLLLLLLTACRLFNRDAALPEATPTAPVEPTPPVQPTAAIVEPSPPATPGPTEPITLTIWTTIDVSPRPETPGGFALAEQLAAFEAQHSGLNLQLEHKSVGGLGGILSYLRTARQVAPTILPDLILLPTDQLPGAVNERLIYPAGHLLPAELLEELFPVADGLVRLEDTVYAYPFAIINLQHLGYNRAALTNTVPATWEALLESEAARLVFPAAGGDGAELALQFYLALGGTLTNETNQPHLEVEPLMQALNVLSRGRATGSIVSESDNVATLTEAWHIFQGGQATVVHTRAGIFLRERALGRNYGYAPIPGPAGPLQPLVRGWTWALATPDPARQALAADLIVWLAGSANLGSWSAQSHTLPARRTAFTYWPEDEGYILFLQEQLEAAEAYPAAATGLLLTALGNAVFDVVTLAEAPQVAAEQAAAEVRP